MFSRRLLAVGVVGLALGVAHGQDSRGRKYKAPPETSHIEVLVLKDTNQKPILNAAVVFHSVKDGKDEGNLEVKTNSEGKATIDVIPTGSSVDVQVIADGFATFAGTYQVDEANRSIEVKMIRPRAQVSTYVDTRGQAASRPAGVQEPTKPSSPSVIQAPQPTSNTSDPTAIAPGAINDKQPSKPSTTKPLPPTDTNPPNVHPDNQYPVDPATPTQPKQQPPTAPTPPTQL
jgi:hypothetical protein